MRSMKFITVHDAVEIISGSARRNTSRGPHARDHHDGLAESEAAVLHSAIAPLLLHPHTGDSRRHASICNRLKSNLLPIAHRYANTIVFLFPNLGAQ